MKKILFVFLLFAFIGNSFSQTETGSLDTYLNLKISNIPAANQNNYTEASFSEINDWENIIEYILDKNITQARTVAATLNYRILFFTDSVYDENYYILEEKAPFHNYWGTYVFNQAACRKSLILQAPHTKHDTKTGKEAIFCFVRLSSKALFLSGTHRCNHTAYSSCSGTTKSCSTNSEAYRVSDMAHNTETVFQKTTEVLIDNNDSAIFVQLHGFGKKVSDPFIIMSNGTRKTPSVDYITILKENLYEVDDSLTFKIAHIDTNWNRLIGFTNTQGRLLNNSSSHCNTSATNTFGNFIHIEQERLRMRQDSLGWHKMKIALENTFKCKTPIINSLSVIEKSSYKIFPSLLKNNKITVTGKNINNIIMYNINGVKIKEFLFVKKSQVVLIVPNLTSGIYFLQINSNDKTKWQRFAKI